MDWITAAFFSILAAGFFVGIVVGLTGMGVARREALDRIHRDLGTKA